MTNNLEAALREALTNARTWFSEIADNASDPSEPVADNGATVWDAVRDFCVQRARDIDAALSAASDEARQKLPPGRHYDDPAPSEASNVERARQIAEHAGIDIDDYDLFIAEMSAALDAALAEGIAAERECAAKVAEMEAAEINGDDAINTARSEMITACMIVAAAIREAKP